MVPPKPDVYWLVPNASSMAKYHQDINCAAQPWLQTWAKENNTPLQDTLTAVPSDTVDEQKSEREFCRVCSLADVATRVVMTSSHAQKVHVCFSPTNESAVTTSAIERVRNIAKRCGLTTVNVSSLGVVAYGYVPIDAATFLARNFPLVVSPSGIKITKTLVQTAWLDVLPGQRPTLISWSLAQAVTLS